MISAQVQLFGASMQMSIALLIFISYVLCSSSNTPSKNICEFVTPLVQYNGPDLPPLSVDSGAPAFASVYLRLKDNNVSDSPIRFERTRRGYYTYMLAGRKRTLKFWEEKQASVFYCVLCLDFSYFHAESCHCLRNLAYHPEAGTFVKLQANKYCAGIYCAAEAELNYPCNSNLCARKRSDHTKKCFSHDKYNQFSEIFNKKIYADGFWVDYDKERDAHLSLPIKV